MPLLFLILPATVFAPFFQKTDRQTEQQERVLPVENAIHFSPQFCGAACVNNMEKNSNPSSSSSSSLNARTTTLTHSRAMGTTISPTPSSSSMTSLSNTSNYGTTTTATLGGEKLARAVTPSSSSSTFMEQNAEGRITRVEIKKPSSSSYARLQSHSTVLSK